MRKCGYYSCIIQTQQSLNVQCCSNIRIISITFISVIRARTVNFMQ